MNLETFQAGGGCVGLLGLIVLRVKRFGVEMGFGIGSFRIYGFLGFRVF